MKNEELLETLEQIAGRLMNYDPLGTKRPALLSQIDELKRTYACTPVQEKHREIYESLVKKGQELQTHYRYSAKPGDVLEKTRYYLGYCRAALCDFTGQMDKLQIYYRIFLITCILFLALSPMWLGPAVLVFLPVIYFAMKGLKSRARIGSTLSLCIAPIALMTAALWVRNGAFVLTDYPAAYAQLQSALGMNELLTNLLLIVPPILGSGLFVLSLVMILQGFRLRRYFV